MRREVFEKRGGYMNVGEAPGVDAARNEYITDPDHKELDMLFLFDHVGIDQGDSKWDIVKFDVRHLREQLKAQQEAVHDRGWASLFTCNHDQPRVVTRWATIRMRRTVCIRRRPSACSSICIAVPRTSTRARSSA